MSRLNRNERLLVLAKAHEVYAKNEYVRVDGRIQRFESAAYHNGMADLYKNRMENSSST